MTSLTPISRKRSHTSSIRTSTPLKRSTPQANLKRPDPDMDSSIDSVCADFLNPKCTPPPCQITHPLTAPDSSVAGSPPFLSNQSVDPEYFDRTSFSTDQTWSPDPPPKQTTADVSTDQAWSPDHQHEQTVASVSTDRAWSPDHQHEQTIASVSTDRAWSPDRPHEQTITNVSADQAWSPDCERSTNVWSHDYPYDQISLATKFGTQSPQRTSFNAECKYMKKHSAVDK